MIDQNGFRSNVGIIVTNGNGQLLWAKRSGSQDAWQFPQGGIHQNEAPIDAMYRELKEELGLTISDVTLLAESKLWVTYRLPEHFQRHDESPRCIGQKQKWFLLKLTDDSRVRLDLSEHPEFDLFKWVNYWVPLKQVIFFKRRVYQKILKEFSALVLGK